MMEDPDSDPGGDGGPSQPRITNRALGGARSDKTRFIRPVERQRMRPWLIGHLDENDIPGLVWEDRIEKIFRISWKHAANQCFNMQKDTNLFERWAIHTGRHQDSDHKRWKANFRCALNSLPDVAEMKEQGVKKGNHAFKVYRFLNEKEVKRGKETRQRKKKESVEIEYYDDEEMMSVKEEVEDGGYHVQPGTSSETTLVDSSGTSLPDLTKLVSSSGQDVRIESKEGIKHITGNMDSLQEILTAATASLAAGSDALALEKISIEQLSHLGEASKVKLDIRQSDRKRRKKDVTGILYVFLCHWCEKVFPSRVDLYQHFLIIHQDKLLSGEEYKMKRETLQQEIEDLEKKVLGFTQDSVTPSDSQEVIEDGQVVDLSSNNSMTSQEIYIEDQALDLSIAGAMAKHSAAQPDVALDLSVSSTSKQKAPQKTTAAKSVAKKRRSSAMDVDYTVKFGNYGLAGAPRTKRQMSLLLKKKEEEEEKQRKQAEAQHSMEDIAHAEILISLKSASNEENETESVELDESAVNEAIKEQAQDVDMEGTGESGEGTSEVDKSSKVDQGTPIVMGKSDSGKNKDSSKDASIASDKSVDGKTETNSQVTPVLLIKSGVGIIDEINKDEGNAQEPDEVEMVEDTDKKTESVAVDKDSANLLLANYSSYKCGICMNSFVNVLSLNEHLNKGDNGCIAKLMSLRESQSESNQPSEKSETCIVCNVKFKTADELTEHKKSHTDEQLSQTKAASSSKSENGIVVEKANEKGAAGSIIVDVASSESNVTVQKNLKGEPVVSPAAGSVTVTGVANESETQKLNADLTSAVDGAGDANVVGSVNPAANNGTGGGNVIENVVAVAKDGADGGNVVGKVVTSANDEDDGEKKEIRNDVVDGEQIDRGIDDKVETVVKTEPVASELVDNIPKTIKYLSQKTILDIIPDNLKLNMLRKDMVLCGLCNLRIAFQDIQSHLESHKITEPRCTEVIEDCPCMICNKQIPINMFYSHLRSHSVYELSVALTNQMTVKKAAKKGKHACNLCYSTFSTQAELTKHVKSHLGPRTVGGEKRIIPPKKRRSATETKKAKKGKTAAQSKQMDKKKQTKLNTSPKKSLSSGKKLASGELEQSSQVSLKSASSSISSPAITAALNRKPKQTSIMTLFTANNPVLSNNAPTVDKVNDDETESGKNTSSGDNADNSNPSSQKPSEMETDAEIGNKNEIEVEHFLAASRRLQEFVTMTEKEKKTNKMFEVVDAAGNPAGSVESDDGSTAKGNINKNLQQKILLVRHGGVKVATPFFSHVASQPADSSQSPPVTLHGPVISQTKRSSNVPVLSPTQVTYIKSASVAASKQSANTSVSSGTVTLPGQTVVPISMVRNLFNLPIKTAALALKKGAASPLSTVSGSSPIASSSIGNASQKPTAVDPSSVLPVPVTITVVSGSLDCLSSSTTTVKPSGVTAISTSTSSTPSSVQLSNLPLTFSQSLPVPGMTNLNFMMAKSQASTKKPVLVPGITASTTGMKPPVFQLAFVTRPNKTTEPISASLTSTAGAAQPKPVPSFVSGNNIFTCNHCKVSMSTIEQLTKHVCSNANVSSVMVPPQVVKVIDKISNKTAIQPDSSTSSTPVTPLTISSATATSDTPISTVASTTKPIPASAVLKPSLRDLKLPTVGNIPSVFGETSASSALVQSPPVKFVLSRSAILAKSLAVSLSSVSSTQTVTMVPSAAVTATESSSTVDSNVLKITPGLTTSKKEGHHALALYPCSVCRQIYMNQESFLKHMQEHVASKLSNSARSSTGNDSSKSAIVNPDSVKPEVVRVRVTEDSQTKTETTKPTSIEGLIMSDTNTKTIKAQVPKVVIELKPEMATQPKPIPVKVAVDKQSKTPLRCNQCLKGFDDEKALTDHLKGIRPNSLGFRCYADDCDKTFCREKAIDFHYSMEHIYKCNLCTGIQRFASMKEFQDHSSTHAKDIDSVVFICDKCNLNFATSEQYITHVSDLYHFVCKEQTMPVAYYTCQACDKKYTDYEAHVYHYRHHLDKIAYRCCICIRDFSVAIEPDIEALDKMVTDHMKEHLKELDADGNKVFDGDFKINFCHVCHFLFPTFEMQSLHMASESHKDQIAKLCGLQQNTRRIFASKVKAGLKRKIMKKTAPSSPAKKFKGKEYKKEDTANIDLHTCCSACKICFSTLFQLKAHKAIWHRSNRKAGQLTSSLTAPVRRWEKACLLCGKRFFSQTLLQKHKDKHFGDVAKFHCSKRGCGKKFTSKSEYENHRCLSKKPDNLPILEELSIPCEPNELEKMILLQNSEFYLDTVSCMIEGIQAIADCFHCVFCNASYSTNELLKQHVVKCHPSLIYQCVDCEQYFHKHGLLMAHRKDCAVDAFSVKTFHTKQVTLGCNVCYESFIQLVSLACYMADINSNKLGKIVTDPALVVKLERLKLENKTKIKSEISDDGLTLPKQLGLKFVCLGCRNEYCDVNDLFTCMKTRLGKVAMKILNQLDTMLSKTLNKQNPAETFAYSPEAVFTNNAMFYCGKCETIVCHKNGEKCIAVLQHPCMHSETLL